MVKEIKCTSCGNIFLGDHRSIICPECKKSGKSRTIGAELICEICGKPFILKSPAQRYCPECAEIETHKAKIKANNNYTRRTYDRYDLKFQKGKKEVITEHIAKTGESFNGFINRAIDTQMKLDNEK